MNLPWDKRLAHLLKQEERVSWVSSPHATQLRHWLSAQEEKAMETLLNAARCSSDPAVVARAGEVLAIRGMHDLITTITEDHDD